MERAGGLAVGRRTKLRKMEAEVESEEENWAASHGPLSRGSRAKEEEGL